MSNASKKSPSTVVSDMMKSDAYRHTQRQFYTKELADLATKLEECKPHSTVPTKGTPSPAKKATTPAPKKAPTPAKAPKPAEEGSGDRVRRTRVVTRKVTKKKSFGDKIHDWFQAKSDQFDEWKKSRETKRKKKKYENDMYHTLDEEEDQYDDFEEAEEEKHRTLERICYIVIGVLVVILIIVVIRGIFS